MTTLTEEVYWEPTTAIIFEISHVISFDALHIDFTFIQPS